MGYFYMAGPGLPVPITKHAEFSATPLTGNAPLTVQFTDESIA
jgi:PKD repeat protein